MTFKVVKDDITKMKTQAIVNAANKELQMGGGVCGAIYTAAGAKDLQRETNKIGLIKVGEAVLTDGYKLAADHVIHAVGPVWLGGNSGEEELLASAYRSALELAKENDIKSISFPLISTGIYGYPKKKALRVAVETIEEFLKDNDMEVYLIVFSNRFITDEDLFVEIEKYYDADHGKVEA